MAVTNDILGKTFCDLTVIEHLGSFFRNGRLDHWWVARCTCGKTRQARTFDLSDGRIKRCDECTKKNSGKHHRRASRQNMRLVKEYEQEIARRRF